jgi:hypothetical protein
MRDETVHVTKEHNSYVPLRGTLILGSPGPQGTLTYTKEKFHLPQPDLGGGSQVVVIRVGPNP